MVVQGVVSAEELGEIGASGKSFTNLTRVKLNDGDAVLYQTAVERGEGIVAKHGPLVVKTGQHTGRSAQDKFIVRDGETDGCVWWDNNKSMTPDQFDALLSDMIAYAEGKELFAQDLFGGADLRHRLPVRIFTQYAWHSLFIRHLLIEPAHADPDWFQAGIHDHRSSGV